MENELVNGILKIVEDKLREFEIKLPDDSREDSCDPIVGYQYAELHDRIQEFLEDSGVLNSVDTFKHTIGTEMEMLKMLCIASSISNEHVMQKDYDDTLIDIFCDAPNAMFMGFSSFIRTWPTDTGKMKTTDELLHALTGKGIKDVLNKLAETAIDNLHDDLANVIDAAESDKLSTKQRERLDSEYISITCVQNELNRLILMPASDLM